MALIVFLVYCVRMCSAALPHGAIGWSAVCACGIIIFWFKNIVHGFNLFNISLHLYGERRLQIGANSDNKCKPDFNRIRLNIKYRQIALHM